MSVISDTYSYRTRDPAVYNVRYFNWLLVGANNGTHLPAKNGTLGSDTGFLGGKIGVTRG
jgi:hypothetical protein